MIKFFTLLHKGTKVMYPSLKGIALAKVGMISKF